MKKKSKKKVSRVAQLLALIGFGVVAVALSMTPLLWSSTLVASAHNNHHHSEHHHNNQNDDEDDQGDEDVQTLQQLCSNGIDDDNDGLIDLFDPDCAEFVPVCSETQHANEFLQCVDNPPVDPICTATEHLDNHLCVANPPIDPTCSESEHLDNHICVANPPVDPVCTENQHLDNHLCVANEVAETHSNNSGGGNGGGGGGGVVSGPLSVGYVNTNSGGSVLGASTEGPSCSAYLSGYLRMGANNNENQVKKLQTFLNKHGSTLEVNGIFDQATFDAVKAFQLENWKDVLAPWVKHGLGSDHTATGYVYKTTLHMINRLECSSLSIPEPQLP